MHDRPLSMADRIHFQDRVMDLALAKGKLQVNQMITLTMADRLSELAFSKGKLHTNQPPTALILADCIRFHDRMEKIRLKSTIGFISLQKVAPG
jgi:hypothetical protein